MADDGPKLNLSMVGVALTVLLAGSSRPLLQRVVGEGLGQWLWHMGIDAFAPRRPSYFLTYEQLRRRLLDMQRQYPNLVRVRQIGVSSQTRAGAADRRIFAVTLGSASGDATRPAVLHIAGIHPNEVANTQVVLGWAEQMLARYGRDRVATSLLDTRTIHIVPMANPDGTDRVHAGYDHLPGGNLRQRKNATPPDGVNINRNYGYRWRSDGGSDDPQHRDYAGLAAESEAETQAIEGFIHTTRPGIVLDWHSMGQMVLWPWGYTTQNTPDGSGFERIGRAIAAINGYHAMKGSKLYATGGSLGDWAYANFRIPVITVETGLWMHQSAAEAADNLRRNMGVFQYAAAIAADPFALADVRRGVLWARPHSGLGELVAARGDAVEQLIERGLER